MSDQIPEESATPKTKADIVREVSSVLSERRGVRRLSLEAASRSLKIRVTFLESLEKGTWDDLPGEVYIRGFIIRYAQYLGLDGKKLLAPYVNYTAERKKEPPAPDISGEEATRSTWIWFGLGILLMIALVKFFKPHNPAVLPEKPAVVESAREGDSGAGPVSAAIAEEKPAPAVLTHSLLIFSPNPLWLRVKTDNKTFEGFISQNATWTWKAEGTFDIKLGHTQQVSILFDNRPVPLKENQKSLTLF